MGLQHGNLLTVREYAAPRNAAGAQVQAGDDARLGRHEREPLRLARGMEQRVLRAANLLAVPAGSKFGVWLIAGAPAQSVANGSKEERSASATRGLGRRARHAPVHLAGLVFVKRRRERQREHDEGPPRAGHPCVCVRCEEDSYACLRLLLPTSRPHTARTREAQAGVTVLPN